MAFHKFIRACLTKGDISVFGDGLQQRDFTYVDDVIMANLAAAKYDVAGQVFNIASGLSIPLANALSIIQSMTGWGRAATHHAAACGDARRTSGSIAKAVEMLNYHPKWDIAAGIEAEVLWLEKTIR